MKDQLFHELLHLGLTALDLAHRYGLDVCFVAVDPGGHPLLVLRHDLAAYPTVEIARRKAATAAAFRAPTHMLSQAAALDPVVARALGGCPDLLAVPGGFPVIVDGVCRAGAGVAGGLYADDQRVLEEALAQCLGLSAELNPDFGSKQEQAA